MTEITSDVLTFDLLAFTCRHLRSLVFTSFVSAAFLQANGLAPTLFALTPQLLSAQGPVYGTASWPTQGLSVPLALPLALGGGGHVCCRQFRYWVLRQVPPDVEVRKLRPEVLTRIACLASL